MTFTAFQGNNVADGSRSPSQDYDTRYATALKLFSGEVYNAFNDATIFKGLIRNYSLRGGKSKQFLLTGKLAAGYHTPGTAIAPADAVDLVAPAERRLQLQVRIDPSSIVF